MGPRQTPPANLPRLWLLTDRRNDAALEVAIGRLPRGSGVVFRHYHLDDGERRARFAQIARAARRKGHVVVLAGPAALARAWRADGVYGPDARLPQAVGLLRLATAHSARELADARRGEAHAVFLSPVFPTRSHPASKTLGPLRFRLLADRALLPVIALGGVNKRSARRLDWRRVGAIDGLVSADS